MVNKMQKKDPVVHFEMPYEDRDRLEKFYGDVFGWHMHRLGEDMGNYVMAHTTDVDENNMVTTPGTINGGFFPKGSDAPTQPSVVISVDDIHDAIKRIMEGGGEVHGAPMEIPGVGHYVSFMDTEGNRVGILQPSDM